MTVGVETLRLLSAAGLSGDDLMRVVDSIEADNAPKRSANAIRQERYRQKRNSSVTVGVTSNVTEPPSPHPFPDKEIPPTPPKEINLTLTPLPPTREPDEFERWYANFPNKVGKDAARRAWPKARKQASYEVLCGALCRYLNKTDDRQWCNPATWLNQARWLDEPATAPPRFAPKPTVYDVAGDLIREMEESNARRPDQINGPATTLSLGFPAFK